MPLVDQVRNERVFGGQEEHGDGSLNKRYDVDQPHRAARRHRQERQQYRRPRQVGDDHRLLAVPTVHEHSCKGAEKQARQGLGGEHGPRSQGRAGPLVDEEGQGDKQEVVPDDREHAPEPEQGEVTLAQYGEHSLISPFSPLSYVMYRSVCTLSFARFYPPEIATGEAVKEFDPGALPLFGNECLSPL